MEPNTPILLPQIADTILNDLSYYLSVIEPVVYQAPLELLSGSTIGQHTRHIIEFYNCLLEQHDTTSMTVINYAKRRRDFLIESAPDHALQNVLTIREKIFELDANQICLLDCGEYVQQLNLVSSTIGRELVYNIEHTIHHLAIIKIALKAIAPAIVLPEHFGVAPSTLRHRRESCAQ